MDIPDLPSISDDEGFVLRLLHNHGVQTGGLTIVEAARSQVSRESVFNILGSLEAMGSIRTYPEEDEFGDRPETVYGITPHGLCSLMIWDAVRAADHAPITHESRRWSLYAVHRTLPLLRDAIRQGASEIYLEQGRDQGVIRLRIDGAFIDTRMPSEGVRWLVSRIRLFSRLETTEHARPQAGKLRVRVKRQTYALEVALEPGVEGERCVIQVRCVPRSE